MTDKPRAVCRVVFISHTDSPERITTYMRFNVPVTLSSSVTASHVVVSTSTVSTGVHKEYVSVVLVRDPVSLHLVRLANAIIGHTNPLLTKGLMSLHQRVMRRVIRKLKRLEQGKSLTVTLVV